MAHFPVVLTFVFACLTCTYCQTGTPTPTAAPSTSTASATTGSTAAPTGAPTTSTPSPTTGTGNTTTPMTTATTPTAATTSSAPTTTQNASMGVEYIGQFESALTESQASYKMNRSNAQDNQTVHIDSASAANMEFRITLCAKPLSEGDVMIRPGTLFYTNDGPADLISLVLDNKYEINATTTENSSGGAGWNQLMSFTYPESFIPLTPGNHSVVVMVQTDQWGVELDALSFIAKNQDPALMLLCDAKFVENTA